MHKTDFNVLDGIPFNTILKQTNIKLDTNFVTRRIVYEELIPKLVNAQDKALVILFFENVVYTKEELLSLKKADILVEKSSIRIHRNNHDKCIKVNNTILNYVIEASLQKEYKPNKPNNEDYKKGNIKLVDNDFIFRASGSEKYKNNIMSIDTLNGRLNTIQEFLIKQYNAKILSNSLTQTTLVYSGMYEKLIKITINPRQRDFEYIMKLYSPNTSKSVNSFKDRFEAIGESPIFRSDYQEIYLQNDIVPEVTDEKFVTRKSEVGIWGEKFILKNLISTFGGHPDVEKVVARNGYDISIFGKYGLEVKTTEADAFKLFHVSITELKKAALLKEKYFIILVQKDNEDIRHIKIIRNPIKALNINMENILSLYGNSDDACTISLENFIINLNLARIETLTYAEFVQVIRHMKKYNS